MSVDYFSSGYVVEVLKNCLENQVTGKDMFLLFEGVLIVFVVQLFYDSIREEPTYQNLLPMQYWSAILGIAVGIIAIWRLTKFSERLTLLAFRRKC